MVKKNMYIVLTIFGEHLPPSLMPALQRRTLKRSCVHNKFQGMVTKTLNSTYFSATVLSGLSSEVAKVASK
jgi:hypothetical protein